MVVKLAGHNNMEKFNKLDPSVLETVLEIGKKLVSIGIRLLGEQAPNTIGKLSPHVAGAPPIVGHTKTSSATAASKEES
ncbi:hypothetical protein EDM53_01905 [Rickettsiales endosymbiont of Peranema trichophorum]|uniref:hypothetical protein n=1 Tax=Rickettsiales endosymbiont of Peranema trichophorum TaxID=2486577 RepID=UPI0010236C51|nr:hypothetical protein [Rickettsiales endosymbiont of Peranema trichophorum]RZI47410.1 hypothetical protein EDM53_01905 [Rickettsiales endosymbiont of Peranema trichophorum]